MDELSKNEESKNLYSEMKYSEQSNACLSSSGVPETDLKNDDLATTMSSSSKVEVQVPCSDATSEVADGSHHSSGVLKPIIPQLMSTNDPGLLLQTPQKRELRVQSRSLSWPTHGLTVQPSISTYISHHQPVLRSFIYNSKSNYANTLPTATQLSTNATGRPVNSSKFMTQDQDSIIAPTERTDDEINIHHQLSVSYVSPNEEQSAILIESHSSHQLEQSLNTRQTPITSNASDGSISQTGNEKSNHESLEKRCSRCVCMDTSHLSDSIDNQSTIHKVKSLLRELFNPNNIRILTDFLGESSGGQGLNNVNQISGKQETELQELSTYGIALKNRKIKTPTRKIESTRSKPANMRGRKTLQNIQPDLVSITGKKREIINVLDEPPSKRAKQSRSIEGNNCLEKLNRTIKNNNLDWHSLNKEMKCQICDTPHGRSLVSHYVNVHPNIEVHTSRIPPDVAILINTSFSFKCEVIKSQGSEQKIRQFCYFCNEYKCYTRLVWIDHIAVHTGYYQFECVDCSRKFAVKNRKHSCYQKNNLEEIPQPHFLKENLKAYICDLCNFVRFDKTEIEKHLIGEHEVNATKCFKEMIFLRLPFKKKKSEQEHIEGSENDSYTENDDTQHRSEDAHVETSKETKFLDVELVSNHYPLDTDIGQEMHQAISPECCTTAETNKKIESITTSDEAKKGKTKEKLFVNEIDDKDDGPKSDLKKTTLVAQTFTRPIIKNNNPEWHSLKTKTQCQMCEKVLKKNSVNHFVNFHPNSEVFTSRLAPDVANSLRNSNHQYEILRPDEKTKCANYLLKQFCYFCNESKCMTRFLWIDHLASHTGYYQYECNDCSKKFVRRNVNHVCKDKMNLQIISQPHFRDENLFAYMCDLCNFVRFNENEIKTHLNYEHEGNVTKKFNKILFTRLSTKRYTEKIANRVEEKHTDTQSLDVMEVEASQEQKTTSSSSSDSTSDSSGDSDSDSSSVSSEEELTSDGDSDSWESISDNDSDIMQVVCSADYDHDMVN